MTEPLVIAHCADGAPATSSYPLFSALLTAAGKVSSPEISSDSSTGAFQLTLAANATATVLEQKEKASSSVSNTSITCPSGNVTFKLRLGLTGAQATGVSQSSWPVIPPFTHVNAIFSKMNA